jgi:hypothetical protein
MTTSQNRHPKGITSGGQFAPDTHAEAALLLAPATAVTLSDGDSDSFAELADGEVIEALDVSRSDDGSGYFVSPSKTVNIKDLITDSDPHLHGQALDAWVEHNSPVIEDFLAERYEANITNNEGGDEVGSNAPSSSLTGPSPKTRSSTLRGTEPGSSSCTTNPTTAPWAPRTWADSRRLAT